MMDGRDLVDYGRNFMGMDSEHWMALQAVHGTLNFANTVGLKYTWLGPKYLSNVYFKMIAGKPIYKPKEEEGGGGFTGCSNSSHGDLEGNPGYQISW